MLSRYFIFVLFLIFFSCNRLTPKEKELKQIIGKTVDLSMFDTVYHNGSTKKLNSIQKKYTYFTIVYIQYGCSPCYSKYIEWCKKKENFIPNKLHSIIFVIEGNINSTYFDFIQEVRNEEKIKDDYYTIIDTGFNFLKGNNHIPIWMINNSLLIDDKNRIRLVGDPVASEKMLQFFHEIVKQ